MRLAACLALCLPFLAAQEPAAAPWTGSGATYAQVPALGEAWRSPGLDLRGRRLQVLPWGEVQWPGGAPRGQDEVLAGRLAPGLQATLAKGLGRGLKGLAAVSTQPGDVRVEGRLLDARGGSGDPHAFRQTVEATFEIRLVEVSSGSVVAGFRERLEAQDADFLGLRAADWFEALGRYLAGPASPARSGPSAAPPPAAPRAAQPALPGPAAAPAPRGRAEVLAAIETLRHGGLLTDAEAEALRRRAQAP